MGKGLVLLLVIIFGAMWLVLRPGVFIVDPIPSLPQGTTLIYLNKAAGVPVIRSTESMCTATFGYASSSCMEQAFQEQSSLFQNSLAELPYLAWLKDLFARNPPPL